MKKKLLVFFSVALLILSLFLLGCGKNDEKIVIGFTQYSLENEFQTLIKSAAERAAVELGVEVMFYDGQRDANVQISQVETMITNGVDAIVMIPQDADACVPCAVAAEEAGIPLLACNVSLNTDKVVCNVVPSDVSGGEAELEYLIEYMGRDDFNIVVLDGVLAGSAQIDRSQGYANVLAKHPNITILAEDTANWIRSEALTLMESWIVTYGDKIDAVLAQNDDMALGAMKALEAANMNDVAVIGIDGLADALDAVESGKMIATLYQDGDLEGYNAIVQAVKAAKGESVEDIYVDFVLITKDNVNEFKN